MNYSNYSNFSGSSFYDIEAYNQLRQNQQNRQDDSPPSSPSGHSAPAQPGSGTPPRRHNSFNMQKLYDALPDSQSARASQMRIDRMNATSSSSGGGHNLPSRYYEIMSVLDRYALGVPISDLQRQIENPEDKFILKNYLKADGGLNSNGQKFARQLHPRDMERLNKAIKNRQAILRIDEMRFCRAAEAFAKPGQSLAEVAQQAGVPEDDLRRFLTESGLTDLGEAFVATLNKEFQSIIRARIELGQQHQQQAQDYGYLSTQDYGGSSTHGYGYPSTQGYGYPSTQGYGYPSTQDYGYPPTQDYGHSAA